MIEVKIIALICNRCRAATHVAAGRDPKFAPEALGDSIEKSQAVMRYGGLLDVHPEIILRAHKVAGCWQSCLTSR